MNKIKEHAKKNNKTLKHQHDDTISSEIDSHMDYLMNLEKKQKIKINTKLPKELEGPVETMTPSSSAANIITVKAGASKNISSLLSAVRVVVKHQIQILLPTPRQPTSILTPPHHHKHQKLHRPRNHCP